MERFITFEGIEGCGKSTQIMLAGNYLERHLSNWIATLEPGGTSIGRRIREMLLNKAPYDSANKKMCAETELLLFSAARAQHVREVILPALRDKKVVLCDRYSDATIAYQGFGRGLDINFIKVLNDFASADLKPGMTILFDLPVEVGLKRARDRISRAQESGAKMNTEQLELQLSTPEDLFEQEELDFHSKVREGYLYLAGDEPERFRIVDASKDIESVHRAVCVHLLQFISGKP
jgi:dTMP kinase